MKKIISLLINIQILVLTSYTSITAQNYSVNEITKYSKTIVNQFERLENIPNKNQTPVNFFQTTMAISGNLLRKILQHYLDKIIL